MAAVHVLEEFFHKIFKVFMKNIKHGIPLLHIPSFDPLKIPKKQEAEINKPLLIDVKASASDIEVTGLSTLDLPSLHLKGHTISAATTTKAIEAKGHYTLDGNVLSCTPVSADSTFDVSIESATVTIGLTFEFTGIEEIFDPKVSIELHVENLKLHLEDFEHSTVVTGIVNSILNTFSGLIARHLEKEIGKAMQDALQKLIDHHKNEHSEKVKGALKELA